MKKILIVEDDADVCLLLNILLKGKGIQVDHVKSLSSAVSYLTTDNPDIVILDNKLPDGYGIDLIPELKRSYPALKIIMMSGFNGAVSDLALDSGADVFLHKPFKKDVLHHSVNDLLNA